ncbi:MAG: signal peptidase II [Actinobacteria bacterium]|nr:signal peptidase II [Actinomycetota bacterium]
MSASAPTLEQSSARGIAAIIAVVVIVLDQASKSWALSSLAEGPIDLFWTLRLRLAFNTGAAFSLGTGFPWLFVALGALVLCVLGVLAFRARLSRGTAVALGLVAGGAVGNLFDRVVRGHDGAVVDFIDLQWWPVFNLADASICIGVVALLLTWRETPAKAESADGPVRARPDFEGDQT